MLPKLWTEGLAFYLDGVGFTDKYNPYDQALAPRAMAWRKPADGLSFQQTAKASHEGSGGSSLTNIPFFPYISLQVSSNRREIIGVPPKRSPIQTKKQNKAKRKHYNCKFETFKYWYSFDLSTIYISQNCLWYKDEEVFPSWMSVQRVSFIR